MLEIHFAFRDWIYSLTIGFLVVSYWRCTWTLLDVVGCDQPSTATYANGNSFCFAVPAAIDPTSEIAHLRLRNATMSYVVGMGLLAVGLAMMCCGLWLPDRKTLKVTTRLRISRFTILYLLGGAAVCTWRGIWYWTDAWILPSQPVASYWLTSLVGAGAAFMVFCGNSLLAPPAMFLLDGPDTDPPPIAITALGAHFSATLPATKDRPDIPLYVNAFDILLSFGFLPFAVVWFWRGSWFLLDNYFWGFTPSDQDVRLSMLWSTIMFAVCFVLASEPMVALVDHRIVERKVLFAVFGRFRTYMLSWGAVNIWRCLWLVWDEFLGGTTLESAIIGHVLSLFFLTAMGCAASICGPAATLGVDSVPHPECDDSPLFSMVPIPWETLHAFAMFRQVDKSNVDEIKRLHLSKILGISTLGDLEMLSLEYQSSNRMEGPITGKIPKQEESQSQMMEESWNPIEPSENREEESVPSAVLPAKIPTNSLSSGKLSNSDDRRSWRPGLVRSDRSSFLNVEKPTLRIKRCSTYAQRPSDDNMRRRSVLFRNR